MRYTTLIDISELPAVYKNIHARLLYVHLVLRAGYHDSDRDIVDISIRRLAMQSGLTVSATRHALAILERSQLVWREGNTLIVKKWLMDETITPRAKTKREQRARDLAAERERENQERSRSMENDRIQREQLLAAGKTPFMLYYESLEAKAAAGDIDAARSMARHRAAYEAQKALIATRNKEGQNNG